MTDFRCEGWYDRDAGSGRLVQSGKYRLFIKVEVLGKGFGTLEQGLDKLMRGIRGTKYVVSLKPWSMQSDW